MERLITPSEVAKDLVVPEKTLADWRHRGIGPAFVRIGKHVRYRSEDVDRWVRSRMASGPAA